MIFGRQNYIKEVLKHEAKVVHPRFHRCLSAQEGFSQWVLPAVLKHDRQAKFRLITSGTDIDRQGRSRSWEYFFDLPAKMGRVLYRIETMIDFENDDFLGHVIKEEIRPFLRPGAFFDKAGKEGKVNQNLVKEQWKKEIAQNPSLPVSFNDSPFAAEKFAAQGVDFGNLWDTSNFTAKFVEGKPVWELYAYDKYRQAKPYYAPFLKGY